MTDPTPPGIQASVLAVLRLVKEAGGRFVNRTTLVKFVYLLDCLYAEEHEGRTASTSHWYFDKFGPFATNLLTDIDRMVQVGLIQARDGSHGDKDFVLYHLGEYPQGPALTDIGLSHGHAGRMEQWVRKYSSDLPKLLDFVYFHTEPMQDAVPGRGLLFTGLAMHTQTARYEPVRVSDQKRLFRLLELAHGMAETHRATVARQLAREPTAGMYDEVYAHAMASFDEQADDAPLTFHVELP